MTGAVPNIPLRNWRAQQHMSRAEMADRINASHAGKAERLACDQMIAAYAALRPQGTGQVRLYVIRITSPSSRAMPAPSSTANLFARTAWSANDTWLLYQGPSGRLWAHQATSGQTRASSTPCCQYTVMVAAPSRSG